MRERKLALVCLAFFVLAFLAVHFGGAVFLEELQDPPAAAAFGPWEKVCLEGQVYRKEDDEKQHVLYLRDCSITGGGRTVSESGVVLYDPDRSDVRTGNVIRAEGSLFFFDEARNPGNFDQKFYYQKQNIHAGFLAEAVRVKDPSFSLLRDGLDRLRARWQQALVEAAGEKDGSILAAMILGDRRGMDPETKELYQVNGIAHILSISGLHLSFIGIGAYQFLRRRTGSFLAGGMLGIAFLLLYIAMIGPGVAVLRSLVMFLVRVGADMAGRVCDMFTSLALAAAVVILWQPLAYYDGGFQMSFGAILGMWIMGEMTRRPPGERGGRRTGKRRLPYRLGEAVKSSLGVQMILFPVTLYHYFEFPLYSVLLNLLVIPLMSALLLLGMLGSLLYLAVEPAGGALIWACSRILDLYEISCRAALALPGCRLVTGRPGLAAIWFYYGALAVTLLLLLWMRRKREAEVAAPRRPAARAFAPVLTGILVLLFAGRAEVWGHLEVTMLDVGQGDCLFLRAGDGTCILVDGGSSDTDQAGRYRIEPFLKAEGVGELSYVFVTHGDSDHLNGVTELLERQDTGVEIGCLVVPPKELWDGELAEVLDAAAAAGVPVQTIGRGSRLACGQLAVACLQPAASDALEPGNAASLVLAASWDSFDMLLTGDVEGEGERLLTERLTQTYDVLKVAHHGSRNSTSEEFLAAAGPSVALISAGRDNRYGHPHEETLERLTGAGAHVFETARGGAVTVRTDGRRMTVTTFL